MTVSSVTSVPSDSIYIRNIYLQHIYKPLVDIVVFRSIIFTYMYKYINTQTDRQTEKQKDRHTNKQAGIQTDKQGQTGKKARQKGRQAD
jgi:hypothetical protein